MHEALTFIQSLGFHKVKAVAFEIKLLGKVPRSDPMPVRGAHFYIFFIPERPAGSLLPRAPGDPVRRLLLGDADLPGGHVQRLRGRGQGAPGGDRRGKEGAQGKGR